MLEAVVEKTTSKHPSRRRIVLEVRQAVTFRLTAVIVSASVLLGLLISALLLVWAGVPAGDLATEFGATFLELETIRAVLIQAAPLIFVGVAASIAFQTRFWNLGLEGQMIFGGIAATAISIYHVGPEPLRIPLMIVAAMIGGAAWMFPPAFLKYKVGVSEIISSLLLNYIAMYFLFDLLFGAWKDPSDGYPHSPSYSASEQLPNLGLVNLPLLMALVAVAVTFWLTKLSRLGYYLNFINANEKMSLRLGIPMRAVIFCTVPLSGALAGLAGLMVTSGMEGRLTENFYGGYGFSGVLIAFLGRNNPVGAGVVAILVAMLFVAGQNLQVFYQVPFAMVQLIQAVFVLCVASSEFFIRHKLTLAR